MLTPLYNDFTLVQGIANDITESKRALARAHRIAEQDTLTGLLNRRGFVRLAGECLNDCSPEHALALMLIDLDGFKRVNDTLGHDAGDQVADCRLTPAGEPRPANRLRSPSGR